MTGGSHSSLSSLLLTHEAPLTCTELLLLPSTSGQEVGTDFSPLMARVMMVNVMSWMYSQSYVRNDLYLLSNNEVPSLDSRNNRVSALSVTQD